MTSLDRCPRLGRLVCKGDTKFGISKHFKVKLNEVGARVEERRGTRSKGRKPAIAEEEEE